MRGRIAGGRRRCARKKEENEERVRKVEEDERAWKEQLSRMLRVVRSSRGKDCVKWRRCAQKDCLKLGWMSRRTSA